MIARSGPAALSSEVSSIRARSPIRTSARMRWKDVCLEQRSKLRCNRAAFAARFSRNATLTQRQRNLLASQLPESNTSLLIWVTQQVARGAPSKSWRRWQPGYRYGERIATLFDRTEFALLLN